MPSPHAPVFDGPRRLRPSEIDASDQLSRMCFGEYTGEEAPEIDEGAQEPAAASPGQEDSETHVIAADGRLVSQITIVQERIRAFDGLIRAGCIGGVCTHPGYRGYGLATTLMEHCTRRLVEGGARLMVISGGRGLYRRLGSVPAGKHAEYTFHPGAPIPDAGRVRLRRITPESAEESAALCGALYAAEPVHYERRVERFREHFRVWSPGYAQEEWIVEMDGAPRAYLMLITDWMFVDRPELGQRRLNEYAGSRAALAPALVLAATQPGIQELSAGIPWQDTDLIHLLNEMGCRPEWRALDGHTMRIIHFPGLLADLRGYIQSRLSPELRRGLRFEQSGPLLGAAGGDRLAIARGRDRLELNGADMTALVMGSYPEYDGETTWTPPALPGSLAEIVPALFPLPSFLPGLNYH